MTYRAYAGIGSHKTPPHILDDMESLAIDLSSDGWTLRSGGANGADTAFELGALRNTRSAEIMLPWNGFNGRWIVNDVYYIPINQISLEIAERFHPAWHHCSSAARKLHARNVHQILGINLDSPVEFVVCWTPNASRSGGTGQALRIAEHYNIPIFDVADPDQVDALSSFLNVPA